MIYLMIGKWERMDRTLGAKLGNQPNTSPQNAWAKDGLYNWQDPDSLWVTINPTNGYVTTKENGTIPSTNGTLVTSTVQQAPWTTWVTVKGTTTNPSTGAINTTTTTTNGVNLSRAIAKQAQQLSGR
jgi:hypothetical protein